MPFLLLVMLTLTCLPRDWPEPPDWLGTAGSAVLPWAVAACFGAVAWLAAWGWRRELRRDASARAAVIQRFAVFRRWHVYAYLAAFFLVVCFGGWGWLVAGQLIRGDLVIPGIDLVLLSPLFGGLLLTWAAYHPLEKALASSSALPPDNFPGPLTYLALQSRHNFLLVAPPLLLMFVQQALFAAWPELQRSQLLLPLVGVGLLASMYIGIPWLLRLLLGLVPLPDGPLRQRLLATARQLSFRFNDILVWDTRHTIVNAMLTGPLPWLRYVIVTDRLLVEMSPEEIEAVFGHEVGHVKHHHLLFYFGFLLASLLAVIGVWKVAVDVLHRPELESWLSQQWPQAAAWLQAYEVLSMLPLLGFLGVYIFVVFGFLSRRCERQADIYGCRTVSVPVFIEALEKVARLNGISRERPGWLMSWQHSTIARRVDFLQKMAADPDLEPRFQRRVGLVKWGMLLSLGAVLAALGPDKLWEVLGKLGN